MEINNENNENVESGGGEITTIEELEGFAGDDCMELREEQVQTIKKEEEEEEKKGFSSFGPIWGNQFGPMSDKTEGNQDAKHLTETDTLKINETNKIKELYKMIGGVTESEKENS